MFAIVTLVFCAVCFLVGGLTGVAWGVVIVAIIALVAIGSLWLMGQAADKWNW